MGDWTSRPADDLVREYREAVRLQRTIPESEQWTHAERLRLLQSRASVALEAKRLGQGK